jgi:ATP phosphoribosyltransferase
VSTSDPTVGRPGDTLRVAIPNKGGLSDATVALLREAGYTPASHTRALRVVDEANGVTFFHLRPRDVARYVGAGTVDLGITGRDLLADLPDCGALELMALGFGRSAFRLATPGGEAPDLQRHPPLRIATSYPRLLAKHLDELGGRAEIVPLDGAVEVAPALGIADAVADVTETGRTLRDAGLRPVGDALLRSEAVLITAASVEEPPPAATVLSDRVRGVVVARQYVMLDYDVPESLADAAAEITPGIEAPTVAPLSKAGWVAIRALVPRVDVHLLMDRLHELGARAILVTDIRNSRL